MKTLFTASILLIALLLTACNPLTQYTISEAQINQRLLQHLHYSKNIGVPGIADAHIVLTDLQSQIGRQQPGIITLTGNAKLTLTSLFGEQQATLKLTLKTQPVFQRQQGAIYLRDLQITDSQATPDKMNSILKTLTPYLSKSLNSYFNENPAYILSASHSKAEGLAIKYAKGIEIKPGEIVIPFTL